MMQQTIVFSFIATDRPGVVEMLSQCVAAAGGNWLESRLLKTAQRFSGIVRVAVAQEHSHALVEALRSLESPELALLVDAPHSRGDEIQAAKLRVLNIIGPDRPGIVRELSQALAKQQINVVDMHSCIESAPMSAELLFKAQLTVTLNEGGSLDALEDILAEVCPRLGLDWDMVAP